VLPDTVVGSVYRFAVPAGTRALAIASRSVVPAEVAAASQDRRRLGVAVERIVLRGAEQRVEIGPDCPALCEGFHEDEGSHRWTDGRGSLPEALLGSLDCDLTIEVRRWSGELTVNEDLSPADLEVQIDLGSLIVRDGTGGLKALTDRDRREIAVTARKTLGADRHPEASFSATEFKPDGDGGGTVTGTLTLAGVARPLRVQVAKTGPDRYHAATLVVQSAYGIKPYTGFLGALRVRDAVDVDVDVDLSQPDGDPGAQQA